MGRARKKLGTCRLCGETKSLSQSHVLPEFFYTPTYDQRRSFISVSRHPRHRVRRFQKGHWEHLLCADCETRFSRYETYAAALLRRIAAVPADSKSEIELLDWDPVLFRLFALSVLWRSHVASAFAFAQVNLGPHAKRLHSMLLAEDPGQPHECCFALTRVEGPESVSRVLIPPTRGKFLGLHSYIMQALGFRWKFVVSVETKNLPREAPFVGFSPELKVLVQHMTQEEFMREMKSMAVASGLLR